MDALTGLRVHRKALRKLMISEYRIGTGTALRLHASG
jgi:hypothetical protein